MGKFELKLPKMGESVAEATLTSWLKDVGDQIDMDEAVVEIATDKVDSEVPSEYKGVLIEKCFKVNELIKVGETIAIIETESEIQTSKTVIEVDKAISNEKINVESVKLESPVQAKESNISQNDSSENRFYSPLVKNIIKKENISESELDSIKGTGKNERITKTDILNYLKSRLKKEDSTISDVHISPEINLDKIEGDQIIEMTKMGKIISKHMSESIRISAHVQSFIEVDVTKIWNWRNRVKDSFQKREGEKLTFTPIFIEAVAVNLRLFPMLNISVDGEKIIVKKDINIGMATALSDGNLIVPVIKKADQLNLVGMTKVVNDLSFRARNNSLNPDDVYGGTYTVTNVGVFGSVMGTPIINQPQVGILALGAIRKVPAVIETDQGDFIGIRHKMFISHSYDHRVVNGALGSKFIKGVKDYLESWDVNREI
ncbi:MAG: dihydrolipoamide acetyltransferase family protein [Bacteroidota bacterium]|nr:dihydrolipoamide acetyltransferase family protein [Bacteroidota bacterium]